MVDRIMKLLSKLRDRERAGLLSLLREIRAGRLDGLDIRKLQGHDNCYRVRFGRFRIIFRRTNPIEIVAVKSRNDHTYDI